MNIAGKDCKKECFITNKGCNEQEKSADNTAESHSVLYNESE